MYRQITNRFRHTISNQYFFYTSQAKLHKPKNKKTELSVQTKATSKIFTKLKDEHMRIHHTMQSFEKMLNALQNEQTKTSNKELTAEQINDFKKFTQFLTHYQLHHHQKEEALYLKVLQNGADGDYANAMIDAIQAEHTEMWSITDVFKSNFDVKTYLTYIEETHEHMLEENTSIFPMIEERLT
eukprot:467575_1